MQVRQARAVEVQTVQELANRAAAGRVTHATTLRLQFQEQMEMAKLQHPATLVGDPAHAGKIVYDHGLDAARSLWRDRRDGLLPARSAFLSGEQQRIEECRAVAVARFKRRQVQDPWHSIELEPQAIGQEHERSCRNLLRTGSGNKSTQRFAGSDSDKPATLRSSVSRRAE